MPYRSPSFVVFGAFMVTFQDCVSQLLIFGVSNTPIFLGSMKFSFKTFEATASIFIKHLRLYTINMAQGIIKLSC